jgi:hypothetical protein
MLCILCGGLLRNSSIITGNLCHPLLLFSCLFLGGGWDWVWTQGLALAKQTLYCLSHAISPLWPFDSENSSTQQRRTREWNCWVVTGTDVWLLRVRWMDNKDFRRLIQKNTFILELTDSKLFEYSNYYVNKRNKIIGFLWKL